MINVEYGEGAYDSEGGIAYPIVSPQRPPGGTSDPEPVLQWKCDFDRLLQGSGELLWSSDRQRGGVSNKLMDPRTTRQVDIPMNGTCIPTSQ